MTYASLMVHLDLGVDNGRLLKVAGDLAESFRARVIGVVASQPMQVFAGDAYMSGELIDLDRAQTEQMMSEAEKVFRTTLSGRANDLHWRSILTMGMLAEAVGAEARAADLFVVSPDGASGTDPVRRVGVGELVMYLGRPLLLAPNSVEGLKLDQTVVGWKDSREARRAVVDAVPLLQKTRRVTVLEIASDEARAAAETRVADVAAWLKLQGVEADSSVAAARGEDAVQILEILTEKKADLFVAGAYGHSRLREWALGGVTRDILAKAPCLTLLSH
jgi:nucleotide-binding universal stress UspA family protein